MTIDSYFFKLDHKLLFNIFLKCGPISELSTVCKLFNEVIKAKAELLYQTLATEFGENCLRHALQAIQLDKKSYPIKVDGLFYAACKQGAKRNVSPKAFDYHLEDLKAYMKPLTLAESRGKLWVALLKSAHAQLKDSMSKVPFVADPLHNSELVRRFFEDNHSELQKITTLNLNALQLKLLPPEITLFLQLRKLDISNNYLTELPDEIGKLQELSEFRVNNNLLQSLPSSIKHFKCLVNFQCSGNQLTAVPDEICKMGALKTLNLSGNQIKRLPEKIGEMKALNYLYLESNKLSSLPSSLGEIPYLIGIYLFNNQILTVPDSICQMRNLKYLSIQKNILNDLPEQIGEIFSLQSLFIDGNAIRKLPLTICKLKNLKHLSVSHNQLSKLPEGMENLSKLSFLDLTSNSLQKFPDGIQNMPFWSLNPDFFPHLNDGIGQVVLNAALTNDQFVETYWRLGSKKWKEGIDGKDHVHGPEVYDLGLHGKYAEPGFLSGIQSAFQFLSSHRNQKVDVAFYLSLHKAACGHFKGKETHTLMGQEKVGVFRGVDDIINATLTEPDYSFTQSAINEFNDLNGELTLHFGSSFRIGNLILKSNTPKSIAFHYHQFSREQVAIVFNYFLTSFYYDIGHAKDDESKIKAIAKLIQRLEWLHPVRDGCGRTDTALLNYLLTVYGFNPVILKFPYITSCKGVNEIVPLVVEGMREWRKEAASSI